MVLRWSQQTLSLVTRHLLSLASLVSPCQAIRDSQGGHAQVTTESTVTKEDPTNHDALAPTTCGSHKKQSSKISWLQLSLQPHHYSHPRRTTFQGIANQEVTQDVNLCWAPTQYWGPQTSWQLSRIGGNCIYQISLHQHAVGSWKPCYDQHSTSPK